LALVFEDNFRSERFVEN